MTSQGSSRQRRRTPAVGSRHTEPISRPHARVLYVFCYVLFDTNFSTLCPQGTCGSERVQGCLGRAQVRSGDPYNSGGIRGHNHSDPQRTPPDGALCGVGPTPTQADDHPRRGPPMRPPPRTPGSMLLPGQRRPPGPPPATSRTRGGRRRRRLAGSPPAYLSGQGLRARLRPHRRATPKTEPVPPRPAPPVWAARRAVRPL